MSKTNAVKQATIATVERETGLSKDTLRVWERRYRFPRPARDGRGERLYSRDQVEKLRVISRLIDRGLRPGQLMDMPTAVLVERFQRSEPAPGAEAAADAARTPMMKDALERLREHDEAGLRTQLSRVLLRLGLQRFAVEFVAPMNELVGDAWSRGEIGVSQEHLYTEQMQYLLRQGVDSTCSSAQDPRVLLTTLPGEEHQLGLLMAHACLAVEGVSCVSLGVQTPVSDVVTAARRQAIGVVGLSFSEALKLNIAFRMLEDLRAHLPANIGIWAGGRLWSRARRTVPGVRFITLLTQIPAVLAAHRELRQQPS